MGRTRQQLQERQRAPQDHDHAHDHAPAGPGNAAAQEQLRQQQARNPAARTGGPQRLTPQQQFQQQYLEQKNRPLDQDRQDMARWRQLSADEVARMNPQDPTMAPQPGQHGYTTTINGQTYRYDRVANDPANPTLTADLMGGQAEQFFSRAFVTPRARTNPNDPNERQFNDVSILNANGTVGTQRQNEHGMVELPRSGFGYSTYNRNDVRLPNGQPQPDQWGTPEMVAKLINIGADYRTLLPNQTVEYGDIATDDNQSPLLDTGRTARHATHGQGNQVDLRYPSNMFQTNSLIRTSENWGVNNFYYDPGMQGDAFFGANSTATPERHHADHLHMGVGRGGR